MLAFLYLCVCALTGMVLVAICIPDVRRLYLACAPSVKAIENIPSTLFVVASGTVTGMLVVPFVNYYVILALSYFVTSEKLCMKIGLMVTAALFFWLVLTCLITVNRRRIKEEEFIKENGEEPKTKLPGYVNKTSNTLFYGFVILLTTVVSAFLMFYTYRIDHGYLLNGYSTFSDLSPHTAMVSSFGKGFNFPTEYMHFSGDGIKYHFLFYFLAGMLERLGFPIDYALNIPSIISMVCAMILLGLLASLLSGRRLAFAFSPVLVFLRSSLNVFVHLTNLLTEGKTLSAALGEIMTNSNWYATTPYDEWGVWAINVYPNQRHLMLGVAVVLICVILFIPFVRRLCISAMSAGSISNFFKAVLFSRNAWLPRKDDPLSARTITIFTCILVTVMPYFHGSCLITLLLVLFGMALVSESRLQHLLVAVCAVTSSFVQTLALSGGAKNVLNMKYQPGFLLFENSTPVTAKVLASWATYLYLVTGATLIVAAACTILLLLHDIIKKKPVYRFFLFLAFLNPVIFAFTYQVTLEMLANHKFIQVSLILVDAFVAIFLANLFVVPGRRRTITVLAADAAIETDNEKESDEKTVTETDTDAKALEENIKKAKEDGELPPVIPEEVEKKEPEEVHFGDDEEPFEVLTDTEDPDDKPEEIITDDSDVLDDSDDADVAFVVTKDKEDAEEDSKADAKDEAKEDAKDEKKDSRLLSEIPSERSVSMRPGSVILAAKAEDEAKTAEDKKADDVKTEDEDAKSDDEAVKTEENVKADDEAKKAEDAEDKKSEESSDPEDKKDEETSASDDTKAESEDKKDDDSKDELAECEELPYEVLEDDDKDESKETALKASDDDKKDDPFEVSVSDDESDEEDKSDMVLEHQAVETVKTKGLPGPVWFIFEIFGVLAGIILLIALIGTGISEWATYININATPMAVNMNSPVTEWIEKNTEPDDVFLTPEWSMNRFLLAGRPMYYGWPYYAWSAGHDTNTRDTIYLWLISGCGGDIKEFKRYCKERGIRYLIADPDFEDGDYGDDVFFNREFFENNLTQVAYFTEENTVIYKIY